MTYHFKTPRQHLEPYFFLSEETHKSLQIQCKHDVSQLALNIE